MQTKMLTHLKSLARRLIGRLIVQELTKATLSVEYGLKQRAQSQAIDYIESHMQDSHFCADREALYRLAMATAPTTGAILEFGTYQGYSINLIAAMTDRTVHGFDSFEGLPEAWSGTDQPAGHFDLKGRMPRVRENGTLHKGWFEDTLRDPSPFATPHVALLHVDCDLYSSTKTVLNALAPYIKSGTVVIFDEYFNYIGWKDHEYKAFQEFVTARRLRYNYIGYTGKNQVAVSIR